uniref:Remorin-4 protein n=2 Tax=Dimocarpus longan TaxID=128017 RepID=L7TUY8_9ROSI|nr:remorin-4 protein [Dimocarpus longan]AGN88928.1 remorin-4 protein [Dimocarpus longan]
MLLGMEKKRKEEQEVIHSSAFTCTSHLDDSGGSDHCKDVDVVSVLPECSTESLAAAVKDVQSRIRSHHQDHPCLEYDNQVSLFEFQKGETQSQRPHHPQRLPHAPFSKPLPSKWDDAQKWIASPTSNRPRPHQLPPSRKVSRQSSTKLLLEVPDYEEPDTKRIDTTQAKKDPGIPKFVSWEADSDPIADSYSKPVLMIENSVAESAISLSRHDSSIAMQSATTIIPPPSTARSVSMRDMGTEMTPIASQEPSRTGTPVRASTPIRSPNSSRPSTPGRTAPAPSPTNPPNDNLDHNKELSEKDLQMKTRREIMALGTQLGKMNIAAWASKEEEEDKDASASLKTTPSGQPIKSVIETRAAAWEEAEKAKYIARFKREEMKIQAWENHQKAKTEADMRKIEVEVERIRGRAHDKLMNKLAAARHKAEEKRAEAEAKRNRQAAKTEQQAEFIRRTGRIPSSFSCWSWCS